MSVFSGFVNFFFLSSYNNKTVAFDFPPNIFSLILAEYSAAFSSSLVSSSIIELSSDVASIFAGKICNYGSYSLLITFSPPNPSLTTSFYSTSSFLSAFSSKSYLFKGYLSGSNGYSISS